MKNNVVQPDQQPSHGERAAPDHQPSSGAAHVA